MAIARRIKTAAASTAASDELPHHRSGASRNPQDLTVAVVVVAVVFVVAVAVAVAVRFDATSSKAHVPQPRRACAWMRTRDMGQDAPYGAAPRPFRAIVALDPKKQGLFFGYFLCGLRQRK
ncbi:hypothetical protein [Lysobacter enzymogenes]|uniref:hypothetical protein n=1 Tax=Lysobacter enzymogenes TaxID=69 RepID=UPI001AF6395E|nr:hypothetical protein [Lysobacter enzymogenes]QQQ01684.1 hypothetical protein JHW41_01475 [Lysobacter enzymogenes]